MVNQWEYEIFAYLHKQKLQGEAGASRLLKGIKEKTSYSDFYPRSKIAWLIEQLAGQKVRRQEGHQEAVKGEQSLISG
jgi:hypothetical protein